MKTAVVIGIGDVTVSDLGAGSYVLEALSQVDPGPGVTLADIGCCLGELEVQLYRQDYAILVQAVTRGFPAGHISALTYRGLERLRGPAVGVVAPVLERLRIARRCGVLPPELTLVFIEPQMTCPGIRLSPRMRPAVRRAVRMVTRELERRGFLPPSPVAILRRYRLELPGLTV